MCGCACDTLSAYVAVSHMHVVLVLYVHILNHLLLVAISGFKSDLTVCRAPFCEAGAYHCG